MHYKFLIQLSIRYIKAHKRLFLPLLIIIFLSTFLLSTAYVIKDVYDDYTLRLSQKQNGAWDLSYAYESIYSLSDEEKQLIDEALTPLMYEAYLSYYYKDKLTESMLAVTNFEVLPLTLLKGTFPTNENELLIEQSFALSEQYAVGDEIVVFDESETPHTFTITGIMKNTITLPTTSFYTYLENKEEAFSVYANIKNEDTIQDFRLYEHTFTLNEEVIKAKYHLNTSFERSYLLFIVFLCLCAFIFIYNASSIYLQKKRTYITQLHMLGATKKQITILTFFEFFFVCGLLFILSLCSSLGIWYLLLQILGNLLTAFLSLSIPFQFVLLTKHIIILGIIIFTIFILSFLLLFRKSNNHQKKKLYFRKTTCKRFPLHVRIAVLDTIRTRYSTYIMLTLLICSTLFLTTQYMVESWLNESKTNYVYEDDITASFNLFNKGSTELTNFIQEIETLCDAYGVEKCTIQYGVQSEIQIGDTILSGYSLDTKSYETIINQQLLSDDGVIVISQTTQIQYTEDMFIHILDQWQSQLGVQMIPYKQIYEEDLPINTLDDSIVLIPSSLTAQWLSAYPSTYISGDIQICSEYYNAITEQLASLSSLSQSDEIYIQNNVENMKQFKRDTGVIRLFIYGFHMIIFLITILVLYNLLS